MLNFLQFSVNQNIHILKTYHLFKQMNKNLNKLFKTKINIKKQEMKCNSNMYSYFICTNKLKLNKKNYLFLKKTITYVHFYRHILLIFIFHNFKSFNSSKQKTF
ncbi:hypothetical protein CVS40_12748 [Lucilia cuprina]|nr:hypothetical protein CVS40_12748 [Lucilia cuprina]